MRHALLASALTLAVLTAAGVTSGPAQAEVLRLNTPAVGLTIDRIGALPDMERGAWADYLARSQAQHQACLLYTSPSPRDKRQSRMPSSA